MVDFFLTKYMRDFCRNNQRDAERTEVTDSAAWQCVAGYGGMRR